MSGKDCSGTGNDALRGHLTKCCGLGSRPDPICPCPTGTTSSDANPCLGPVDLPVNCPCPPPPPCGKLEIKCESPPTASFECPCSPPPPEKCEAKPACKEEKVKCPPCGEEKKC